VDITRSASQGVREDTAELASLALSDIASSRSENSPARHPMASLHHRKSDSYIGGHAEQDDLIRRESGASPRPDVIEEVSEPSSPHSSRPSQHSRCQSALTELIKKSPATEEGSEDTYEEDMIATAGIHPITVREGIISQPGERTSLLAKHTAYGSTKDIESQKTFNELQINKKHFAIQQFKDCFSGFLRVVTNPKSWNKQDIWKHGIQQPVGLIPSVILGLLLNVLDALSYGRLENADLWRRN